MVVIAAAVGVLSGVAGSVASSLVPRLPTGPTIVLVLSVVVAVSMLFAPGRGLMWRAIRLGRLRRRPDQEPVLIHLYALSLQHEENPDHGHNVAVLRTMSQQGADIDGALNRLAARGLARCNESGLWAPTEIGRREALKILDRESEDGR